MVGCCAASWWSSDYRGLPAWCYLQGRNEDKETSEMASLDGEATGEGQRGGECLMTVDGCGGEKELEVESLLRASAYILGATGSSITYKAVLEDGTTLVVRRIGEGGEERLKDFEILVRAVAKMVHTEVSESESDVGVKDVTCNGFEGTSTDLEAILLKCSSNMPCKNIVMDQIHITSVIPGKQVRAVCENAKGMFHSAIPEVHCIAYKNRRACSIVFGAQLFGHRVSDVETIKDLIEKGSATRSTGTIGVNEESSGSHAMLQLVIKRSVEGSESKPPRGVGKLSFIDLAGSECGADTTDNDKQTRMEGAEINKSFLALKECIRALDNDQGYIPFRGSKLTEFLRDSFVGRSHS